MGRKHRVCEACHPAVMSSGKKHPGINTKLVQSFNNKPTDPPTHALTDQLSLTIAAAWTPPQTDDIGGVLVPYAPWFRCFSPTLDEQIAANRTEVSRRCYSARRDVNDGADRVT